MKKKCQKCKRTKESKNFHNSKYGEDKLGRWCKACQKRYYNKPKTKIKLKDYLNRPATRDRFNKRFYNISLDEYNKLLLEQNSLCAICSTNNPGRENKRFNIDHDHKTGRVRGLLCYNCNLILGNAKDNINILINATHYLARNQ
jgi:hypothetical protein